MRERGKGAKYPLGGEQCDVEPSYCSRWGNLVVVCKGHPLFVLMGISLPERWDTSVKFAMTTMYQVGVAYNPLSHTYHVVSMFLVPVWFEPTGVDKAVVPVREGVLDKFQYVSPNLPELRIISETLYGTETNKSPIHGNHVIIIITCKSFTSCMYGTCITCKWCVSGCVLSV